MMAIGRWIETTPRPASRPIRGVATARARYD
jgi:hypothetical protein